MKNNKYKDAASIGYIGIPDEETIKEVFVIKNKLLIRITLLLLVSTVLLVYISFDLRNKLEATNSIIDSVKFSEFINLNNSIQQISEELMDYKNYENENENELYLSKLGKEGLRLNEIGINLRRLIKNDYGYRIYEERTIIIERFIKDISKGSLTDKEKIHQVAIVMDEQQKNLHDMFFVNQIGVAGLNEEENIEKIMSILDIIIDEINKAR